MGDLEELPKLLAELRELIPQAHAAAKDLSAGLREHRKVTADGVKAAGELAADTAADQLRKFAEHLQKEMNRAAAELNIAVNVAREAITSQLTPRAVTIGEDGHVEFTFNGNFDADVPPETAHARRRPRRVRR
jgi:F0F1-type ATP synthase membrane subunit b/b'